MVVTGIEGTVQADKGRNPLIEPVNAAVNS